MVSSRARRRAPGIDNYEAIFADITAVLERARRTSARVVNRVMTAAYWEVGCRIVEWEQGGTERAQYGVQLVERLSRDLASRFGRGFSPRALYQMREFYRAYPPILQSASAESSAGGAGAEGEAVALKTRR